MDGDLRRFLDEDIGTGDITTDTFVPDISGEAVIVCEEDATVAGIEEACDIFQLLAVVAKPLVNDGDRLKANTRIMKVSGPVRGMLTAERTALNFLMRMSGTATMTAKILDRIRPMDPEIRIAATRKTTPGFRYYEKKASLLGGGWAHRMGLYDRVLVKDNHILACGGIENIIKNRLDVPEGVLVEIEVTDIDQAVVAAKGGVDIIMADHFSPENTKKLRETVRKIDNRILVEASGNITSENVTDYAGCADIISLGELTHSVRAVHFSMDITRMD